MTTSPTEEEIVARALYEVRGYEKPWEDAYQIDRDIKLKAAKTAIRALDHHRAKNARANWQPIETAPKDGTVILGYWWASKGYALISWSNEVEKWLDEADGETVNSPPHWHPLPEPPLPTKGDKE